MVCRIDREAITGDRGRKEHRGCLIKDSPSGPVQEKPSLWLELGICRVSFSLVASRQLTPQLSTKKRGHPPSVDQISVEMYCHHNPASGPASLCLQEGTTNIPGLILAFCFGNKQIYCSSFKNRLPFPSLIQGVGNGSQFVHITDGTPSVHMPCGGLLRTKRVFWLSSASVSSGLSINWVELLGTDADTPIQPQRGN